MFTRKWNIQSLKAEWWCLGTADEFKLSDFFFCFVLKIDIDFPTIVDTKEMYGEFPLMNIEAYSVDKPITG